MEEEEKNQKVLGCNDSNPMLFPSCFQPNIHQMVQAEKEEFFSPLILGNVDSCLTAVLVESHCE